MLSDYDLAVYAAATYAHPGDPPVAWDHSDDGSDGAGVCWFLKYVDGYTVVAFEGSHDLVDWERDFFALPIYDAELGMVHPGFLAGLRETWAKIKPYIKGELILCGHSLGAARATDVTALAVLDGIIPARRVVLGEPRPGGAGLAALVSKVPGVSYCTVAGVRRDFVTCVPLAVPGIAYEHPTPVQDLPAMITPESIASYGELFAAHYPPLYVAALRALCPAPAMQNAAA